MRYLIISLACLLFGLISSVEAQQPRKVAVVVGVNQYSDPSIPSLRYAAKDAQDVSQVLRSNDWDVITITSDASGGAGAVSLSSISEAFSRISKSGPIDSFLFYFCGHGFTNAKRTGFLALGSTRLSDLEGTALSVPALIEASTAINSTSKSFFFDACRNVPGRLLEVKKMDRDLFDSFKALQNQTSAAVFLSCMENQLSYESERLQNGVFTAAVVEGLKGQAASEGVVTSSSLMEFVTKRVPELEREQRPWIILSGSQTTQYSKGVKRAVAGSGVPVKFDNQMKRDLRTKEVIVYINDREVTLDEDGFFSVKPGKQKVKVRLFGEGAPGFYTQVYSNGAERRINYSMGVEITIEFEYEFKASPEPVDFLFFGRVVDDKNLFGEVVRTKLDMKVKINDQPVKASIKNKDYGGPG